MQGYARHCGEVITLREQMDALWDQVLSILQEGIQRKMILKMSLMGKCRYSGLVFIFNLLKKSMMVTFLILSHADIS